MGDGGSLAPSLIFPGWTLPDPPPVEVPPPRVPAKLVGRRHAQSDGCTWAVTTSTGGVMAGRRRKLTAVAAEGARQVSRGWRGRSRRPRQAGHEAGGRRGRDIPGRRHGPHPSPDCWTWTPCIFFYELPHLDDRRLLLLHGRYGGGKATLQVDAHRARRRPAVRARHRRRLAGTPRAGRGRPAGRRPRLDDDQIGWDVRGHGVRRGTLTVDLATIVQRRFGATDLDPRACGRTGGWWRACSTPNRRPGGARRARAHARRRRPRAARGPLRVRRPARRRHAARLVAGARTGALPCAAGRGTGRVHRERRWRGQLC